MSEPTAFIRDHQSLIELNNTLEYSADSMLKLLESVNDYIHGVLDALKKQKEVLDEQLKIAEEELSNAERELSACESSQTWDEEYEEYTPSCDLEQNRVQSARYERDKCQEQVNRANEIIRDCECEIEKYKKTPGFVTLPGAEKVLEYLAKSHTDGATSKLRKILEVVDKYLQFNVSINTINTAVSKIENADSNIVASKKGESIKELSPEEKKDRFNNAIKGIIDKQEKNNTGNNKIEDANKVMRCKKCGRPLVACICQNDREKEYTRENIQILTNNYSHE